MFSFIHKTISLFLKHLLECDSVLDWMCYGLDGIIITLNFLIFHFE